MQSATATELFSKFFLRFVAVHVCFCPGWTRFVRVDFLLQKTEKSSGEGTTEVGGDGGDRVDGGEEKEEEKEKKGVTYLDLSGNRQ